MSPSVPWKQKMSFARDIVAAVDYLHTLDPPVVHRDLKAANVLVSASLQLKLSDFGLASLLNPIAHNSKKGTVAWTAPEVLLADLPFTKKADVYSLGVVLWELLNKGATPFAELNVLGVIRAVEMGQRPPLCDAFCCALPSTPFLVLIVFLGAMASRRTTRTLCGDAGVSRHRDQRRLSCVR